MSRNDGITKYFQLLQKEKDLSCLPNGNEGFLFCAEQLNLCQSQA